MWVIVCQGDAIGGHQELVGHYLAFFDPDHGHAGEVRWSAAIEDALHFESLPNVFVVWRTVSITNPLRPDGQPNRPLTAWNIEPRLVEQP